MKAKQNQKKGWLIYTIISAVLFYASIKGFKSNPETYLWPFLAFMGAVFILGHAVRIQKDNKEISA